VRHNINNVLNGVGLACEALARENRHSSVTKLRKVTELICANQGGLESFFASGQPGAQIPEFLSQLSVVLQEERSNMERELDELRASLGLMKDIIKTQQESAKGALELETMDLTILVEDALRLQSGPIERHRVAVVRRFETDEPIKAQKAPLTHILINLVKNAVEAMGFSPERVLTLTTRLNEKGAVCLEITDTGMGLTKKEMANMFRHGFTTKRDGHGFGLHYCARTMHEMGGDIEVRSEGRGKGAAFLLHFPPTATP